MQYWHYTDKPVKELFSVGQENAVDDFMNKPSGFWFTDSSSDCWATYCNRIRGMMGNLTYRHPVSIKRNSGILRLKTIKSMLEFTNKYGGHSLFGSHELVGINWARVARDYPGIMIMPYRAWAWMRHNELFWYYGWDCSSGCVWNVDIIEIGEAQRTRG